MFFSVLFMYMCWFYLFKFILLNIFFMFVVAHTAVRLYNHFSKYLCPFVQPHRFMSNVLWTIMLSMLWIFFYSRLYAMYWCSGKRDWFWIFRQPSYYIFASVRKISFFVVFFCFGYFHSRCFISLFYFLHLLNLNVRIELRWMLAHGSVTFNKIYGFVYLL